MPTNAMPTNAMPTNAMQTNTMPTNAMQTNTMPLVLQTTVAPSAPVPAMVSDQHNSRQSSDTAFYEQCQGLDLLREIEESMAGAAAPIVNKQIVLNASQLELLSNMIENEQVRPASASPHSP